MTYYRWGAPQSSRRRNPWTSNAAIVIYVIATALIFSGLAVAHYSRSHAGPMDRYDAVHAKFERLLTTEHFGYDPLDTRRQIARFDATAERIRSSPTPDQQSADALALSLEAGMHSVQGEIADWRTTFAPRAANRVNRTGTDAEQALISVSGGAAEFAIDTVCDSGPVREALACVSSGPTVHVPPEEARLTDGQLLSRQGRTWRMVMMHEYAHVVQQKYRYALSANQDFRRLFGSVTPPPWYHGQGYAMEVSAECMARSRIRDYAYAYPVTCSDAQVAFGERIWSGDL